MGSLHARVTASSPDAELAWIADPDPSAHAVANRFGAVWLDEPRFDDVDAVIVAAPTGVHHQLALATIEAGLPLMVEKPLAGSYDLAVEIVEAARAAGTVLMCGFVERFNPAVRTALEIVRDPVHVATMRHSPYAERIVTGVAADLLIHDVDLVLRMFGERPTQVGGALGFFDSRSRTTSEDVAEATLVFSRGQIATMSTSRIAQRKVRTLHAVEAGREIEVDLVRQSITVYRHVGESAFDEDAGYRQQTIMEIPVVRHVGEPLQLQLQHFLGLIDGSRDAAAEIDSLLAPHEVIARIEGTGGVRPT